MSKDLTNKTATQLLRGFKAKHFSPLEVLDAKLTRIDECEPVLNAFRLVDKRRARRAAKASTDRWMRGRPQGLLDGVPVAIKDVTETRGWPTLNGSLAIDPKGPWQEDAIVVERFRAHGAVIVGKTETPEFAWWGVTESELHGRTKNPWNPAWTPGGSSGGSAAAVASGMVAIATGTDSGGSIRGPASFCNIVGVKPTFGRVPIWPPSPMMMMEHCGPLTRGVQDAALALNVMAGFDPRDGYAMIEAAPDFLDGLERNVRGLKIGFSPDLGIAGMDPVVARIVGTSKRVFKDLGAGVANAKLDLGEARRRSDALFDPLALRVVSGLGRRRALISNPALKRAAESGAKANVLSFLEGEAWRRDLRARMAEFHTRYDLLIAPTLAAPPFDASSDTPPGWKSKDSDFMSTTVPFDLTGQPAISVPCGFTADGGPVGLQIIGPVGSDALVLRAARAYEKANPVGRQHPPL